MKRSIPWLLLSLASVVAGACGKNDVVKGTGGARTAPVEGVKATSNDPATNVTAPGGLTGTLDGKGATPGTQSVPAARKWSRVCKGTSAGIRNFAKESAPVSGTWPSETPFLAHEVSADGKWMLASRTHDGKKAWLKASDSCDLDDRRSICSVPKASLFYADSLSTESGKFAPEGSLVTLAGETSNAMDKVTFSGTKYWVRSANLCPYDPNTVSGGAASAMLSVIAYAEGTKESYNIIYTFATFSSFTDHPRRLMCSGGLCSDAAGRYQFLSTTWDGIRSGLGSFGPANQDEGAKRLMRNRGVNGFNTRMDYGTFASSLYKMSYEWASLPGSPYGQPVKTVEELWAVYKSK